MKLTVAYLVVFNFLLFACKETNTDYNKTDTSSSQKEIAIKPEQVKDDIKGVWELYKMAYNETDEPSIANTDYRGIIEINDNYTYKRYNSEGKWFLSATSYNDTLFKSAVIYSEIRSESKNTWGNVTRDVRFFLIKTVTENNTKMLYMKNI